MSGTESKGKGIIIPKPFVNELTGIIQTVNLFKDENEQVTGARGQMSLSEESIELIKGLGFSLESDRVIYKITQEKLGKWDGEESFQRGDKVTFGSAYITTYKGKTPDWKGLLYASLCRNGFAEVLLGERTKSKFQQKAYRNPLKTTKAETAEPTENSPIPESSSSKGIVSDVHRFENLQKKIEDTQEKLTNLHKIASLKGSVAIDPKDFLRVTAECSLYFHRMLCAILYILEKEE